MIYGINFNGTEIPDRLRRPFTDRIRKMECGHVAPSQARVGWIAQCPTCDLRGHVVWFRLQGVADSQQEADLMVIQANNGHRKLHVEQRTDGDRPLWAIYTY